jgi:hypothetical protein
MSDVINIKRGKHSRTLPPLKALLAEHDSTFIIDASISEDLLLIAETGRFA